MRLVVVRVGGGGGGGGGGGHAAVAAVEEVRGDGREVRREAGAGAGGLAWCSVGSMVQMARISFSKPMSSMRSASSRTTTVHRSSEVEGQPPAVPCRSSMSIIRPGVATTMSAPLCSSCVCFHLGAPP